MAMEDIELVERVFEAKPGALINDCLHDFLEEVNSLRVGQRISMIHNAVKYTVSLTHSGK